MEPVCVQGGDTRPAGAVPSLAMHTRYRLAIGSLLGAFIIHIAMLACSSGGSPVEGRDASVLSDVRDAIANLLDAETRDAHAGGDGGTPTCNCPEPARAEFSFSGGAVSREGATTQEPATDFSTVTVGANPYRVEADGTLGIQATLFANYYLRDNANVTVTCTVLARADRTVIQQSVVENGMTRMYDAQCSVIYRSSGGTIIGRPSINPPTSQGYFAGSQVSELTANHFVITLPALAIRFQQSGDGGQTTTGGSIAPITVRADVPGAAWLTPPRMYRP